MQEELSQVVSRLVGSLVEKYKNQSLAPLVKTEPVRIPRAPNMTYFQYLTKVLRESGIQTLPSLNKKSSFKLHEDLEILVELSSHKVITVKLFEDLAQKGKIHRSAENMRIRYQNALSKIQEKDLKKIIDYVEREGLDGYLVVQGDDVKISKVDPQLLKETGGIQKRPRTESLDKEGRKIERETKKIILPSGTDVGELHQVLNIYSKTVGIPVDFLLEKLNAVSGDLVTLDKYVQTKDYTLLWTEEEDQILASGGVELEVLKRYRGESEIMQRKKYLGMV